MARRVEDIELALGIVSGVDWQDPSVVPMPLGDSASIAFGDLRVATYTDNGLIAPTPEIASAVRDAAAAVASGGARVSRAVPEAISEAVDLIPRLRAAEGGASVRSALARAGTERPGPMLRYALDFPTPPPGSLLSDLMSELERVRARMLAFMRDFDAIVCPVSSWCARPSTASSPRRSIAPGATPWSTTSRDGRE